MSDFYSFNEIKYDDVLHFLLENANSKKAEFDKKLIFSKAQFIGIYSSQIKDIAKKLSQNASMLNIINMPDNQYYEVDLIKGIILAKCQFGSVDEKIKTIEKWLVSIDNWAVCDSSSAALKIESCNSQTWHKWFLNLCLSDDEYVARYGIVGLLNKFCSPVYNQTNFSFLQRISYGKYRYVDLAAAWFFSVSLIKDKENTIDFLFDNKNNIGEFVFKKSFQKAIESFRICSEDKDYFRQIIKNNQ